MRNFSFILLSLFLSTTAFAQEEGDGGEETPSELPAPVEDTSEETATPTDTTIETTAPKDLEETIVVIQRKPFLHKKRLELAPLVGGTLNDPFLFHYSLGGALNYYFSDVLSVGIQGQKYFQAETGLETDVLNLLATPALNRLDFYGGVHFSYSPIYGKFALFNQSVVGFETYVTLGAGVTGNSILEPFQFNAVVDQDKLAELCGSNIFGRVSEGGPVGDDFCDNPGSFQQLQLALSPSAGLGFRFFVSDFVSVVFDVKDYFFQQTTLDGEQIFTQNVVFSVGTSFFLPSSFTYTTPR